MLTFYYNPLSPNCRRVWLTLLEKNLAFNPVILALNGDQWTPEFTAVNPFHHVPVLQDDETQLIESLAILDYLDLQYPEPVLTPQDSKLLAQVRMVQFLTVNELMPGLMLHIYAEPCSPQFIKSQQQLELSLVFLSDLLQDAPFFGGESLSVADIVSGTVIPLLQKMGVDLSPYGALHQWCDRIQSRRSWKITAISEQGWYEFQRRIQVMARLRQKTQSSIQLKPILPKQTDGGVA